VPTGARCLANSGPYPKVGGSGPDRHWSPANEVRPPYRGKIGVSPLGELVADSGRGLVYGDHRAVGSAGLRRRLNRHCGLGRFARTRPFSRFGER
jgi:hypothetical protein